MANCQSTAHLGLFQTSMMDFCPQKMSSLTLDRGLNLPYANMTVGKLQMTIQKWGALFEKIPFN